MPDLDVRDGRGGKFQLNSLPMSPVIEEDVHAQFGTGVEEMRTVGILAHYPGGFIGGDPVFAICEERPALAEIVRPVDVRSKVAAIQEAIHRGVGGSSTVRTGLNVLNAASRRKAFGCHVRPVFPIVASDKDQAIV